MKPDISAEGTKIGLRWQRGIKDEMCNMYSITLKTRGIYYLFLYLMDLLISALLCLIIESFFFYHFWLHWVFVAVHRLSGAASSSYSGCSVWASYLGEHRLWGHTGFSRCGMWALGAQVPSLWHKGSAAPWHVEFFQARIEPMFPALAGRLPTSGPPGKSWIILKLWHILYIFNEYLVTCLQLS